MQNKNAQYAVSDCKDHVCGYRTLYVLGSSLGLISAAGVMLAIFY